MKKTKKEVKRPFDQNPMHPDKRMVTRRDFLSSGAIGFSGMVVLPTLLQTVLFEQAARATGVAPQTPFIIFDCAGGLALPGNWMPTDQGGQPLNYLTLGLGNPAQYVVDTSFGAPMAAPTPPVFPATKTSSTMFSQVYDTLTTQLNPGILGTQVVGSNPQYPNCKLQMGIVAANSMSDSQSNTFSPISLISSAGLTGTMVKNGMGTTAAQSGGNSDWGSASPAFKPLQIRSVDALSSALSYGTKLQRLGSNALNAIATGLLGLSNTQASKFQSMTLGQQFSQLTQSGFNTNQGFVNGVTGIDPTLDPDAQAIYTDSAGKAIGPGSSRSDSGVVAATLVLNAIMGNSGPVVLTVGGCDYHDATQTTGDKKDAQLGSAIAMAMNLAFAKKKKVAFAIYTDGGIYSDAGLRVWRGDDNQHGLAVFGVMDGTTGGTKPVMAKSQIGWYNSNNVCDPMFAVGNDPLKVCHTLFLNYLAVTGQVGNYTSILAQQDPRNTTLLPNVYSNSFSQMTSNLLLFPNATG